MSLFESVVERIDLESASITNQFGAERKARHRSQDPRYLAKFAEAEKFMDEIYTGRRPLHHFSEAMSTSDFPLLFADSLDRQLYGAYMATTPTWANYTRAATVNDFREVKRFATSGIRGLLGKVGELGEYKMRAQGEAEYTYKVEKYGAAFGLSFEAMINDDLNAFMRLPQDLADSVRDSEEEFVTKLFAGATGPNTTHYTVGNDNLLNTPLTRTNLQAALTKLMERKDANGNPIQISAVELVVGPGNALNANEIIETREYRVADGSNVRIISGNGISANLRVNVNYWIPSVVTSGTHASTAWWLFASPNGQRPAMEFGRLRGYEAPALYEKIPDARRIGGGEEMFDFETDAQAKKVRHIFGGVFVDPKMTIGSTGQ